MRISSSLLLVLLPLVVAHMDRLRAIHHHSRRIGLSGRNVSDGGVKRAEGVLGGIISGKADDDSSVIVSATTSPARASAMSAIPTTTSIAITTTKAVATDDDTSTLVPLRPSTTSSALVTGTASSSLSSTGVVSGTAVLNSTSSSSVSAAASTTISANDTLPTTSAAASSTFSSPSSTSLSSASVHYTTDAAGQTQLVTVILTQAAATEAPAPTSAAATAVSRGGGGISTGAIIGISVAAGVVVLALILLAVWRMKTRTVDEDEAIRWPELNRHGDSSAHHALPARQTGQHGFDTNPLERSLSNSSSIFSPPSLAPPHSATPMALNGSSFGAASSLEEEYPVMSEKYPAGPPSHDDHDNYTSLPPIVQLDYSSTGGTPMYGGHDEAGEVLYGGMSMANSHHVTYPQPAASNRPSDYRIE
ncbi:hypothetical protein IAR55_003462 [Kwoniella newhampshirensis]|uniref:Mid2 domain-containing protein n=1 Tax=Kwoniella newhampshirensis TaxID=1651941 RepID=A0AAW0YYV0_9TREE